MSLKYCAITLSTRVLCRCLFVLSPVLVRVFPVQRSIFEDKVANLWAAIEPVARVRRRMLAGEISEECILICRCAVFFVNLAVATDAFAK